ncbi:hypothetical protein P8C59_003012 [Phyllachora maydis]|uniref:Uncharacterized protein n=1 Tax=Phyllachora maydis TaxID=1825666 RepID=A0AAD9M9W7_9PEZI|nr:hypothetical protein P8C59_003012 [Phyllachora maydis]
MKLPSPIHLPLLQLATFAAAAGSAELHPRTAGVIPPFNVTDFYGQVRPDKFDDAWWYWVEFNVTIRMGEGMAGCYAWQTTSSNTSIDTSIPVTACTEDEAIFWAFTVGEGSYGLTVGWNESMRSILQGNTTIRGTDFQQGEDDGVQVVFYNGVGNLTLPVTQILED